MYHLVKKEKGFFSNDLYKGQLEEGKREGFGLQLFANGCFYVGFWKNNKAEGLGKLVIKDGTFYEGIFSKNLIKEGVLQYYNGAKFEGSFDNTPYDRFKSGTFTFKSGIQLVGEWNNGALQNFVIYENSKIVDIKGKDLIIRKKNDFGIIFQKGNKWMYEGGIKEKMCNGEGIIYCTFQQYKSGNFQGDKMNGKCFKTSLNWGEISEGQFSKDVKIGNWKKMLNKGYLIESNEDLTDEVTVSFPYLNDDYFVGTIAYSSDPKSKDYGFLFKQGVYYNKLNEITEKRLEINKTQSIFDISLVEKRIISFNFTFKRIFKNTDILKKLIDFLKNAIKATGIRYEGDLSYFLSLTNKSEIYEESQSLKNDKKINEQMLQNNVIEEYYKKNKKSMTKRKHNFNKTKMDTSLNVSSEKHVRDLQSSEYSGTDCDNKSYLKKKSIINRARVASKNTTPIKKSASPFDKTHITLKRDFYKKKLEAKKVEMEVSFGMPLNKTKMPINSEAINSEEERSKEEKKPTRKKTINKIKNETYSANFLENLNSVPIEIEKKISFFNGSLVEGKKSGYCSLLYNTGVYIEAFFVNDIAMGSGRIIINNGFELSGTFVEGVFQGEGEIKFENKSFSGNFKNGVFSNSVSYLSNSNVFYVFDNKEEKQSKTGLVSIYSSNFFKLIEVELVNGIISLCKCKMFDNLNNFWIGKIKKVKDNFFFETLNSPISIFTIDLEKSGLIEIVKSYK